MKNKFKVKTMFLLFSILVIVFLIYYFKKVIGLNVVNLNIDSFEEVLKQNRDVSIIIYIVLSLIRPIFIVIPVWIFSVVSGVIYGPIIGTIYALIGVYISATSAFYFARFLGRDFFVKKFGNLFNKLDNKFEESGFKVLFIMRVTVVFPFDPLSFMAGLSKISYRPYIIATLLGSIPETIAFNFLGVSLKCILSLKVIIILSVVLTLIFIVLFLRKRVVQ